ncbi:MAG: hypothetical protein K8R53_12325 [Bacteroidales bacterium]|nr:hypothetical protein [Bacteroidales bacterium]
MKKKGYAVVIAVFLLLAACSVQKNYPTLSFFFDGVPNPEIAKQAAIADSLKAAAAANLSVNQKKRAAPGFLFHQPYVEKKCSDCHNQGRMGTLNLPMPELCYQCHTNFGTYYLYEHGPAAGGFCSQCHHPHKSKKKKLLLQTGNELCFNCHDATQLFAGEFHDPDEKSNCLDCHNPHGSKNHSLLYTDVCTQCHENYKKKFEVVHGPVSGGYCTACHVPHRSGKWKLLNRTGRDLCLNCHNSAEVMANESHEGTEDAECTDCHSPHGGDDRFMFY